MSQTLSNNALNLERAVLATLSTDHMPTEMEVDERLSELRMVFPVGDEEFHATRSGLHAKLTITLNLGTAITREDYRPWLSGRKAEIEPFYWERYRQFLVTQLRLPPLVVNMLDRVTDDILDLSGDPTREGQWARKGLIVGDVQSGKTATYTALCCKAADAGFKLVILLTGTIESLRRQTQERLDEGFVGRDSFEFLQKNKIRTNLRVGVGLIDARRFANVFTSRSSDFSIQAARQLGFSIAGSMEPILLVCKKNAKILENLRTWLQTYNADTNGRSSAPLLLIDDEADSASINTRANAEEATRTNREIRKLLRLFDRSAYIGVTATPFANVFINPDTEDEMIGDDLFPRDFIYSLESPDNYVGPRVIFEDGHGSFLQTLDDAEGEIPAAHKVSFTVQNLPKSLIEAMYSFVLATTVRDLRGEGPTHRSMLVNVSRFTNVQNQAAALLDVELRELQRQIRLYASLPVQEACARSHHIALLHEIWRRGFDGAELKWNVVQQALHAAVQPIVIKTVNQSAGTANLDYKANQELGLRVITVGGNSLSRGLTLEGLSTSYFYRNSHMYDTLLQMGRWFGYRIGYEDLCRLWLTEDAASWYTHITTATEELRAEFKRMHRLHLTPKDFGLKVRSHPDSLIVTARNKMREAKDFVHSVSLSEAGLETTRLRLRGEINSANYKAVVRFVERVMAEGVQRDSNKKAWRLWGDVPKLSVAALLQEFQSDPLNFNFNMDAIAEFLSRTEERELQRWDVAVVSKEDGEEVDFAGIRVRPVSRGLTIDRDKGYLLISGSKRRVGSGDDEAEGLSKQEIEEAHAEHQNDKSMYGKFYREKRKRPLLLVYLIRGHEGKGDTKKPFRPSEEPLVAIALSFPKFDDSAVAKRAEYKVNIVEWRMRFENEAGDDDELEQDEIA